FPQLGLPSGILLSQLVFLLLSGLLSDEQFLAWGWRIAFLSSAVLIIVGLFIRLRIEESTDFEKVRASGRVEKLPVVEVFRRNPRGLLIGSLASIAAPATGYLITVYMVSYGTTTLRIPSTTMLWIVCGISVWSMIVMITSAVSGDRFRRRTIFAVGAGLGVLWAFPMFWLVDTRSVLLIVLGLMGIMAANSIMSGVQPALITQMFPIRLRYSGSSIAYTVASILGGGLTPLLATALYAEFGSSAAVSALVALVCLVSLGAILAAGPRTLQPRDPDDPGDPGVAAPPVTTAGPAGSRS
ncbi:MFS transporter, partial [Pseudonocardia sp. KRD291]|uniref:MFS transporter n=1 Tax=Pseudonocardia sp. KRD291 TaxID=2792007 RepID=UPI001C4A3177